MASKFNGTVINHKANNIQKGDELVGGQAVSICKQSMCQRPWEFAEAIEIDIELAHAPEDRVTRLPDRADRASN
jgi:hypothetical protein